MNWAAILCWAGSVTALGLAAVVFLRESRSVANLAFLMGMLVVGVESGLCGLRFSTLDPEAVLHWEYQRMVAMAFFPSAWLTFALCYSRGNQGEFLRRWRYAIGASLVGPLVFVFGFADRVVMRAYPVVDGALGYVVMGWSGTALHICQLCFAVLALLNLERTFRASVGTMRWRIKFMVVGLGVMLAGRVYTSSQSVLYSGVDLVLGLVDAGVLVVGGGLVFRSLLRAGLLGVDVYPSRQVIQNSLTVLLTGLYLVSVGIFARLMTALGGEGVFPLRMFAVLVLVVVLTVLLLSDRVQRQIKQLVTRHFRRPEYDYRQVWMTFTDRTGSLAEEGLLCRAIARWVSETFNALTVTIWLTDEARVHLRYGASTGFGEPEARRLLAEQKPGRESVLGLARLAYPMVIEAASDQAVREVGRFNPVMFPEGGHRVCVPLVTSGVAVGVMVVGDRVGGVAYGVEDLDLLKCIGDQAAGALSNIELSQKLLQAKEMEAFQAMSTFFVHDLKNTASTLSLMLKNLPEHFHDPAFRADALRSIGKTVDRINDLIARLSLLRQKVEMRLTSVNVNRVVEGVLEALEKAHKLPVKRSLGQVGPLQADPDQLQKVLTNLVLNAKDALGKDGLIEIATGMRDSWVSIEVIDNGCGMPPEFVAKQLFRPFQTTKKKGIGIGMFHTKMIVEAHRGVIEVQSEPGRGTTFRVLLPV